MSSGAWIMMIAAWTVVILFTVHFFIKVLLLPTPQESDIPKPKTLDRIHESE